MCSLTLVEVDRQTTHNSVQVFYHMERLPSSPGSGEAGQCQVPSYSPSLGSQPGRHHLRNFHQCDYVCSSGQRWACCRALGEKAHTGIDLGSFLPSDAGDMIEMQGFGPSLTAWHLEPLCSQGSSCLSCSSSSSPYATPSHCSCIPDR